ncbi:MAG: hypothetical protein JO128_19620 [Alphaproteobacteria bacterium]|nr:hypothetical protein [Alphaproteobacteria bacterium]
MRGPADIMARVLPLIAAVVMAAGAIGDVPLRGILDVAASAKGGAAGVSGRAAKGATVTGKPKPDGSVNGGKR